MLARKSFGPDLVKFINQKCVPFVVYSGINGFTLQTVGGKVLGAPKPGHSSDLAQGYQEFVSLPLEERRPKDVPDQPSGRSAVSESTVKQADCLPADGGKQIGRGRLGTSPKVRQRSRCLDGTYTSGRKPHRRRGRRAAILGYSRPRLNLNQINGDRA